MQDREKTKRLVLRVALGLVLALVAVLAFVRVRYGGGQAYADLSTAPRIPASQLERLVSLELPPGNVAVSADGRVFFNTHPFAAPRRLGAPSLFELVDGQPQPYPSAADQDRFQGPFGLTIDDQSRLWMVETAGLDHEQTRLIAIDLASDAIVIEHASSPASGASPRICA